MFLFPNIVKLRLPYISFSYLLNPRILHIHYLKTFGFVQNDIPAHSMAIPDIFPTRSDRSGWDRKRIKTNVKQNSLLETQEVRS